MTIDNNNNVRSNIIDYILFLGISVTIPAIKGNKNGKNSNLNILQQEFFIIIIIIESLNIPVTISHSHNNLKYFQCKTHFFYAEGPQFRICL